MKRAFWVALILSGCLAGCLSAGPRLFAQAPAGDSTQKTPQTGSNPFPEDTTAVPVLPSTTAPPLPEGTYKADDNGEVRERVPASRRRFRPRA